MTPLYRRPDWTCSSCVRRRKACFQHQGLIGKWGDDFALGLLNFMCKVPVWLSKR